MISNLMLHILNFSQRHKLSPVCCITMNRCLYYSIGYKQLNVYFTHIFKRCLESQTSQPKKIKVHDDRRLSIPTIHGNNLVKYEPNSIENLDVITANDINMVRETEASVLEPCNEDISDVAPFALPAFHLAAYVNGSFTLQQFVHMGVQLDVVERKEGAAELILKLDFDKHVKPYLRFLHDVGVPAEELGKFVTKNPFIFEQNLDDLQIRINYLEAKKFTVDGISRIVTKSPLWLNFSTVEIDKRLGFFQRLFILSGDEVRTLAVKRPPLITYNLRKVTISHFAVKEEMGFNEVETKSLLLKSPKIFDINTNALKSRFDFVHNVMGISHDLILQQSDILLFREFIMKQRHEFLKELGKAQYDPKLPNYVSLETLVQGSDIDFCRNVAKTSIDVFNTFLKTR